MPKCCLCGNTIEKLPAWLDVVDVSFRCGRCPESSAADLLTPPEGDEEEPVEIVLEEAEEDEEVAQELELESEEDAEEA